jgi:hypothetical protein
LVQKSHQSAAVGWQQLSVGKVRNIDQGQPHYCTFLKFKTIFFAMNGMQEVFSWVERQLIEAATHRSGNS